MGSVELQFARDLRDSAGLTRAVETGTYKGITARSLAGVFPVVVTIELSRELAATAAQAVADLPQVRVVQGHSVGRLAEERDPAAPTLYFLDGHWSGGSTEGADDECPVLDELRAIGAGHADDCFIIDDARLFASAPPPPHQPDQWPELPEVFDALRELRQGHLVTLLNDQVIAVPRRCKPAVDAYGVRLQRGSRAADLILPLIAAARERLKR